MRRLADALRACGLVKRLDARDAGRVDAPAYVSVPVNRAALVGYTRTLADRIGALLDAGARPLVLGGDCSILLGAMLALRRRARHGLRARRRAPRLPPSGLVGRDRRRRGRGPRGRHRAPGARAVEHRRPRARTSSTPTPSTSATARATRASSRRWRRPASPCGGCDELRALGPVVPAVPYWVHVDADVIDSALLPAVDSPAPDGLTFEELAALLREVARGRRRRAGDGLRPRPRPGRLAGAGADGLPRRGSYAGCLPRLSILDGVSICVKFW